jgi:hypothetical protein
MFEVDGVYANRKGTYTVISIDTPKMHVRYEDGTYAELRMDIQGRIWQNILVEREAESAKASRIAREAQQPGTGIRYYLKSVSLPATDELMFPGWQERVVLALNPIQASRMKPGDRIIYYAIETDAFFSVATITTEAFKADPKEYFYNFTGQECDFFQVDIDAVALGPDKGIARDTVELEDYPNLTQHLAQAEGFVAISEDDFELLAELLTELSESDANDDSEEDFEEDDED